MEAHRVLPGLDGVTYTPEDVNPEEFKWKEFERELGETELGFDGGSSVLVYVHPESHVQITIQDDDTLQAAIITLRKTTKGYTIVFIVMDRTDPQWTGSTKEPGEERLYVNKKRKHSGKDGSSKPKKSKRGVTLANGG